MGFIIVWRNNGRDPFIQTDSHYFVEEFSSFDDAKESAEANIDDDHFQNYAIYEEVAS